MTDLDFARRLDGQGGAEGVTCIPLGFRISTQTLRSPSLACRSISTVPFGWDTLSTHPMPRFKYSMSRPGCHHTSRPSRIWQPGYRLNSLTLAASMSRAWMRVRMMDLPLVLILNRNVRFVGARRLSSALVVPTKNPASVMRNARRFMASLQG